MASQNTLNHTCTHLYTPVNTFPPGLSCCPPLSLPHLRLENSTDIPSPFHPYPQPRCLEFSAAFSSLNCQLFRSVSETISSSIIKETTSLTPQIIFIRAWSCVVICGLMLMSRVWSAVGSLVAFHVQRSHSSFAGGKCVSHIAFYYLFTWLRKTSVVYLVVNSPS